MKGTSGWTCPDCGRKFGRKPGWHSCVKHTVEEHFAGKPPVRRATFDALIKSLKKEGSFSVDPVKTAINLSTKRHFAVVRVIKTRLKIEFRLGREIESPRFTLVQRPMPGLFIYHLKLQSPEEVDGELISWLREARSQAG